LVPPKNAGGHCRPSRDLGALRQDFQGERVYPTFPYRGDPAPSPAPARRELQLDRPYTHHAERAGDFLPRNLDTRITIAIGLAWNATIKKIIMPAFVFLNSLPIVAIAPLLVLWFGYGLKTNILIAFLVSFFPVVINTTVGLFEIEDDLLDLVKYLNGSKLQIFLKRRLPNSLPYIFTGLKISSTMCVVGAIVGEFVASDKGLGYIIINSQYTMDSPPIFAGLMLVSLFGVALFGIVSAIERLCMPWQFRGRNDH
jgi:ABC-type proline/glycine betaine transport system permease subunit